MCYIKDLEGDKMHKLISVLLMVLFCSCSLYAAGGWYMLHQKINNWTPNNSVFSDWGIGTTIYNPSQLVFIGKEKQLDFSFEGISIYLRQHQNSIKSIAFWKEGILKNINVGLLYSADVVDDEYEDAQEKLHTFVFSSSLKEYVGIGFSYNRYVERDKYFNEKCGSGNFFSLGLTGQYPFAIHKKVQIKPKGSIAITSMGRDVDLYSVNGSDTIDLSEFTTFNWGVGIELDLFSWLLTSYSIENSYGSEWKFGPSLFLNQNISVTPYFTIYYKWPLEKEYVEEYEILEGVPWSGFSIQCNLQQTQELFNTNLVPKRFNLDLSFRRIGRGKRLSKGEYEGYLTSTSYYYRNQFSVGVAFLPEGKKSRG